MAIEMMTTLTELAGGLVSLALQLVALVVIVDSGWWIIAKLTGKEY
jgi:hypothetical protein